MSTETFGQAGSVVGGNFVPAGQESFKAVEWLYAILTILVAILLLSLATYFNAEQVLGRLPSKFVVAQPGVSLVAQLNTRYQPTTDFDRHRLDLLGIEVARTYRLPVFVDGMRVANYAIAKHQLNDAALHTVFVPLAAGETVYFKNPFICRHSEGYSCIRLSFEKG